MNIHCNHISKQGKSVFFWINCDEYFSLVSKMLLLFLLQNNHMSIFTHSPQSRRYFCTLALFSNIFFTMSIFCISYPKRHVTTNYINWNWTLPLFFFSTKFINISSDIVLIHYTQLSFSSHSNPYTSKWIIKLTNFLSNHTHYSYIKKTRICE